MPWCLRSTCRPRHLLRSCFGHVVSQECRSCHFVLEISLEIVDAFVTLPVRRPYLGFLALAVDRISTSFPVVLLEDPPVMSDSCGATAASCSARMGTLVAASSGSTSHSYGLLVVFSSRFACAGSYAILAVILARHSSVCGCPVSRPSLEPSVAPISDFLMQIRLPFSSFLDFVIVGPASTSGFAIGSVLARDTELGSTSTRPSCMHRRCQAACRGSSAPLGFASGCCGTSSQLPCR